MLQLRCRFKVLFVSYERLAAHFQVDVRTIGRWMTELKELYLISDKKRWLQSSLYKINPMVLKFSDKYKQIFPALKYYVESALGSIFPSNVLHSYNDSNNTMKLNSSFSSSHIFLKINEPTFVENLYFQYKNNYELTMTTEEVRPLSDDEVDLFFGGAIKLTVPELIQWYNENK